MNIKPLRDQIVLKPIEEVTKSGIVIPDTADREKPEQGEILAVGSGKMTDDGKIIPLSVKIGDKVLFTKYGPTEVKVGDEEYLIVKEEDILAILEG
jgi:chaperonin GroES